MSGPFHLLILRKDLQPIGMILKSIYKSTEIGFEAEVKANQDNKSLYAMDEIGNYKMSVPKQTSSGCA